MNVFDISNFILGYCKRNNISDCSNKKLLKLLYYVYCWELVLFNKNILEKEYFEAWLHGPVIATIYEKYRNYGANCIDYEEEYKATRDKNIDKETQEQIETILKIYTTLTAQQLENKTHQESPWLKARMREDKIIAVEDIQAYYTKIWNDNNPNKQI